MHGGGPRKLVILQVASSRAFTAEQRRNTTSTHVSIRGRLGMGKKAWQRWLESFSVSAFANYEGLGPDGKGLEPVCDDFILILIQHAYDVGGCALPRSSRERARAEHQCHLEFPGTTAQSVSE